MTDSEYHGRTVLVTGAASGIGGAVRSLLVEAGAKVFAWDVKPIDDPGVRASACDLLDPQAIDAAVAALPDGFDAVFACAGLSPAARPVDVVTVNLLANIRLVRAILPKMNAGGAIATVASLKVGWEQTYPAIAPLLAIDDFAAARDWIAANVAGIDGSGYMLSKHALIAWTFLNAPAIAAGHGVRLNTLCPGKTDTPMMDEFRRTSREGLDALPVPIGRNSEPIEQARVMLAINAPSATYLVGEAVSNDGGSAAALIAAGLRGEL